MKTMMRKTRRTAAIILAVLSLAAVPQSTVNVMACNGNIDVTANSFTSDSYSYVNYDANQYYMSEYELSQYSGLYLMLLRNEIYARHGYIFRDQNIARYFNYKDWYYPTYTASNFSTACFNDYEKYNIDLIVSVENRRGGAVKTIVWYD